MLLTELTKLQQTCNYVNKTTSYLLNDVSELQATVIVIVTTLTKYVQEICHYFIYEWRW